MRELTKSFFSFSWALSLFGVRQAGNLLDPRSWTGRDGAPKELEEVTDATVRQFGDVLRQTFEAGDRIQGEMVDAMFAVFGLAPGAGGRGDPRGGRSGAAPGRGPGAAGGPAGPGAGPAGAGVPGAGAAVGQRPAIFDAHTSAGEEVLVSYTRGEGRFSQDQRYIALRNTIHSIDGREDGLHEGVWQALFASPQELLARPAPPTGPMDRPVGPVEKVPVTANTIAKWTFGDGSAISSVGPAASHLIPLSDGSFLFLVITAQVVTEGTGRYQGARGLTQSLGATHVPAGVDLFGGGAPTFPAATLDTFKIRVLRGAPPVAPRPATPPGPSPSPGGAPGAGTSGWTQTCLPPRAGESRYVEVEGSRMHYVESGVGEPVVFLHGNPTWSYLWRNVLPEVAPGARCIAPDLIGMGLSDKPEIRYGFFDQSRYLDGFLDALGLERYTLVIHDWGAILGFYHAMRHESRVRGIAFMEGMLRPYRRWSDFPEALRSTFQAFRTPNVGYEQLVVQNVFVEQLLPASMVKTPTPAEMDCYRGPFAEPLSRRVIWRFAQDLPVEGEPADVTEATREYARWLERTRVPKLLLWAKPGAITTEADVAWCRDHLKTLQTVSLGDGIHFHQEDHPQEIGRAVARWHQEIS